MCGLIYSMLFVDIVDISTSRNRETNFFLSFKIGEKFLPLKIGEKFLPLKIEEKFLPLK